MFKLDKLFLFFSNNQLATFFLSFLFIFALTYGILYKINLFKDKKINILLSLILGAMATIKSSPCISKIMPNLAIGIVALLIFFIILDFSSKKEKSTSLKSILFLITITLILYRSKTECSIPNTAIIIILIGGGISLALIASYKSKKKNIKKSEKESPTQGEDNFPKKEGTTTAIFVSDIHGNNQQYQKLIEIAKKIKPEIIILGGDIAPKNFGKEEDYIKGQREYLKNDFIEIFSKLKENGSECYIIMGNDDCSANRDILKKYNGKLFHLIDNKRLQLTQDHDIVGYPYVPITPFKIKDWEKIDITKCPKELLEEYNSKIREPKGIKSTKKGFVEFEFGPKDNKNTIQKDLKSSKFSKNPKKTIYVLHSPPYKTNLDKTENGHVGSFAIKFFIEEKQPFLTLHGHIHESVSLTGKYLEKIGKTISINPGNDNNSENLSLIILDLNDPESAKRLVI